jgi:putative transposase
VDEKVSTAIIFNMIDTPHRRSIRLKGYDYTQPGAYFVTLLAWQRQCLFGEVAGDVVRINELGQIIVEEWNRSATIRQEIELDEFIVMPNHFHAIIWIVETGLVRATGRSPLPNLELRAEDNHRLQPKSLGSLIAGFKAACTTRINRLRRTTGLHVWHRNYHDHIIRNEDELNNIRLYVLDNPRQWVEDEHNPQI